MAAEALCFVQFIHPGNEAQPSIGRVDWNLTTRPHRRKFLLAPGGCMQGPEASVTECELMFWGEWEPPSLGRRAVAVSEDAPQSFATPLLEARTPHTGLHNTDPFVFGDRFRYTNCKQWTTRHPTQMRYLSVGSVILFGSRVGGRFALDTVLVVGGHFDHGYADFVSGRLQARLGQPYFDVTMRPTYVDERNQARDFRLYEGATPAERVGGMFSFFPCLPADDGGGFARPHLELPGTITQSLSQGQRLNRSVTPDRVHQLWQEVVDQVLAQGLLLGTFARVPREAAHTA